MCGSVDQFLCPSHHSFLSFSFLTSMPLFFLPHSFLISYFSCFHAPPSYSLYLCVSLSISLSPSISLCVYLPLSLSLPLSLCVSLYLPLSLHLPLCLSPSFPLSLWPSSGEKQNHRVRGSKNGEVDSICERATSPG